jgi:hypothetical protein
MSDDNKLIQITDGPMKGVIVSEETLALMDEISALEAKEFMYEVPVEDWTSQPSMPPVRKERKKNKTISHKSVRQSSIRRRRRKMSRASRKRNRK